MAITPEFERNAATIDAACKQIDAALRELSSIAPDELTARELRDFRRLRRQWARWHADAQELAEEVEERVEIRKGGGGVVIMGGGT